MSQNEVKREQQLKTNNIINPIPANTGVGDQQQQQHQQQQVPGSSGAAQQQHQNISANIFPFIVREANGSTYLAPRNVHPDWIELKVGVLLPFHQQANNYTKELTVSGSSAIRMAANEINEKQLIPGAYITLIEKDSYPKEVSGQEGITQPVFQAVSLIQEGVIGVIGDISSSWTVLSALMTSTLRIPQCSFSATTTALSDKTQYGYFFRTVPTQLLYADAALSFITSQGWPVFGILYTKDDIGQQLSEALVMKSKLKGAHVKAYQKFYEDGPESDIQSSINTLMNAGVRIVFIAAEGEAQIAALAVAAHLGHINDRTVWLTMGSIRDDLAAAVERFNAVLRIRSSSGNQEQAQAINTTAVARAGQKAKTLTPIAFNETFSGGVFTFETSLDLQGYPPYESFLDRWAQLDPAMFPFAGQRSVTANEGPAYSCMMVMAQGFNHAVSNSTNTTVALETLSAGLMGEFLTPAAFNNGYVGPVGPMMFDQNGDVMVGNFKVFNIQHGAQVEIGHIIADDLTLTSAPLYHDGTYTPPRGVPTRAKLNAGLSSPLTIVVGSLACLGTLIAVLITATVITYRKREIFKASSPLFCILELCGFIFLYSSILFYMAERTKAVCITIPITFHIGFSLVLANLIAKNYRIYRIFNNVFITKTVVTDMHLLRVSGTIVVIESSVLLAWLATSEVLTIDVPLSRTAYNVQCAFQGPGSQAFSVILTILPGIQLAVATFLAIKTRTVGKRYSKYSEYKQIGISVYNIFFSALIGFVIFSVPTSDYFTRHYLTAFIVLWATTFTMLILFVPKLHSFFSQKEQSGPISSSSSSDRRKDPGNLLHNTTEDRELVSINHMLASPTLLSPSKDNGDETLFSPLSATLSPQQQQQKHDPLLEIHEARVPVQRFLKWVPFLAAWDMKHVFLCPTIGCFSIYSEKSHQGYMLGYTRASIVSCSPEAYIFRVHGKGFYDMLIQVGSQQDLEQWCSWFNHPDAVSKWSSSGSRRQTMSSSLAMTTTLAATVSQPDDMSIDKPMLLAHRKESAISLQTIDSCIDAPRITESNHSTFNLPALQIPYFGISSSGSRPNGPDDIGLHDLIK